MTRDEIIHLTNKALIEEFELDEESLQEDASITEDLHLDSLDIVDMVIIIEKLFKVTLENKEEMASIKTLGNLYDFLVELQSKQEEKQA